MRVVDLRPPPGYEPLPSVISETSAEFRWPVANPRTPFFPPKGEISVEGPLQSPPCKPRLRYHRQSSYTDAYVKFLPASGTACKPVSEWNTPIGKHGLFIGESLYEKDFDWPQNIRQAEAFPPLASTVGLGILPLLGKIGGRSDVDSGGSADKVIDEDERKSASVCSIEPSYWVLNCNPGKPVQRILDPQTTHRTHYTMKVIRDREKAVPKAEESYFQVTGAGKMETESTAMRDYGPKDTDDRNEEDVLSSKRTSIAENRHETCHCQEDDVKTDNVEEHHSN